MVDMWLWCEMFRTDAHRIEPLITSKNCFPVHISIREWVTSQVKTQQFYLAYNTRRPQNAEENYRVAYRVMTAPLLSCFATDSNDMNSIALHNHRQQLICFMLFSVVIFFSFNYHSTSKHEMNKSIRLDVDSFEHFCYMKYYCGVELENILVGGW